MVDGQFGCVACQLEQDAGGAGNQCCGREPAALALGSPEQAVEVGEEGMAMTSAQVAATARQGVKWLPFPTARNMAIGKTIPQAAPSQGSIGLFIVFSFGRGSACGGYERAAPLSSAGTAIRCRPGWLFLRSPAG
jgi:hypothetical protein